MAGAIELSAVVDVAANRQAVMNDLLAGPGESGTRLYCDHGAKPGEPDPGPHEIGTLGQRMPVVLKSTVPCCQQVAGAQPLAQLVPGSAGVSLHHLVRAKTATEPSPRENRTLAFPVENPAAPTVSAPATLKNVWRCR